MNPIDPTLPALPELQIDARGWCPQAQQLPSPNCDARPVGACAELLVIHNISLPPGQFGGPYILDLFANRLDISADPYFAQLSGLRVSAHFLIRRDGQLLQFVSTLERAWHAGLSSFEGRDACNDFSIGVELEGSDLLPFMPAQYVTLQALTAALHHAHTLHAVSGHQHIAAGRKTDPGPYFDWQRYQILWTSGVAGDAAQASANAALRFVTTVQTPPQNAIKKTI